MYTVCSYDSIPTGLILSYPIGVEFPTRQVTPGHFKMSRTIRFLGASGLADNYHFNPMFREKTQEQFDFKLFYLK